MSYPDFLADLARLCEGGGDDDSDACTARRAIVAIDGPSGSGKSTVVRAASRARSDSRCSTPARCTGRSRWPCSSRASIRPTGPRARGRRARSMALEVGRRTIVDGRDVSAEIRGPEVTATVSTVSAHPGVREVLVRPAARVGRGARRRCGRRAATSAPSCFPTRRVKVFLTASDEERARRRQRDEVAADRRVEVDTVHADLARRDAHRLEPHGVAAQGRARRASCSTRPDATSTMSSPRSSTASRRRGADDDRRASIASCGSSSSATCASCTACASCGREHVPRNGRYIIAPSHRSMLDIPFAGAITTRRIRFMGKAPLFRVPVLGCDLPRARRVPGRARRHRPSVRSATRCAILEAGEPLVVYPEGTRQRGREIAPLQAGAAYLAAKAGRADRAGRYRGRRGDVPHRARAGSPVSAGSSSSSASRSPAAGAQGSVVKRSRGRRAHRHPPRAAAEAPRRGLQPARRSPLTTSDADRLFGTPSAARGLSGRRVRRSSAELGEHQ